MLNATNITFGVGGRELLSDVSLRFDPGKFHLIVGPNGAGKSTLIKILARLLHPQKGTVKYDGIDIKHVSESDLAKRRAVLSQAIEVAFPISVQEIVAMGRYPHFSGRPSHTDQQIVDELIGLFDLTEFRDRNYQTLSGGERQRVNFARVLAQLWPLISNHNPEASRFLFLDEPLTFLDIRHQIDFMKKVSEFAAQANIVAIGVVHDLNLAARFAKRVVLLNNGQIVADGTPIEALNTASIRDVFGVESQFIQIEGIGTHIIFD